MTEEYVQVLVPVWVAKSDINQAKRLHKTTNKGVSLGLATYFLRKKYHQLDLATSISLIDEGNARVVCD